jgi:type IV secretory pathway VirB10-like protein
MAINIPGNSNRKPEGVGLAFAGAGVVLVIIFLGAFYLSRSDSQPQQTYKAEDLTTTGVDTEWFHRDYPSTVASPTVSQPPPATQPHVVVPQDVYRQTSDTSSGTTPNPAKQARMQALMRAMSSDIEVKLADSNVLETPQADPQQVAVKLTPAPPHTLLAWTWIDARLETPIDSDHSGDVLARVSHPARDLTQTEILIPAGSLLHGTQQGTNRGNLNDTSLVVAFDDLEFPNGAHLLLPKMNGMDTSGAPGLVLQCYKRKTP